MANEPITAKERYKYLVNARNYHYSQFNIWMAFFIAIIGALLVAYSNLPKAADNLFAEKLVLAFGYVVSMLFHLSSKGYYYWITNWITLIREHEEKFMPDDLDRVYSCFANEKENNNYLCPTSGANISTSKIVCFLSYLFTFAFGILLLHKLELFTLCDAFKPHIEIFRIIFSIIAIIIVNTLLCLFAEEVSNSDLRNHKDLGIKFNKEKPQNDKV